MVIAADAIVSPCLPGGDLVAAALNRQVMVLADRGGASGLVGARWADICAAQAKRWIGKYFPVPGSGEPNQRHRIERIARLDDRPLIGESAARQGLQNPDILLIGSKDGRTTVQAADAKFSVETARAKQVSAEVVAGLLTLGPMLTDLTGDLGPEPALVNGLFLCPDFPLTHLMLRRKWGIVKTTVRAEQVAILPVSAESFFNGLEGAPLLAPLAAVDELPLSHEEHLLAGLYYFRLARAAIGCWLDASSPLLPLNDRDRADLDVSAVVNQTEQRATRSMSAWELILHWDADVQPVRAQRAAVDQVAALPIANRDLRELIGRMTIAAGLTTGPSVNKVRRRLGAWHRARIRERLGPLSPPIDEFGRTLQEIGLVASSLSAQLEAESRSVIAEMLNQFQTDGQLETHRPVPERSSVV